MRNPSFKILTWYLQNILLWWQHGRCQALVLSWNCLSGSISRCENSVGSLPRITTSIIILEDIRERANRMKILLQDIEKLLQTVITMSSFGQPLRHYHWLIITKNAAKRRYSQKVWTPKCRMDTMGVLWSIFCSITITLIKSLQKSQLLLVWHHSSSAMSNYPTKQGTYFGQKTKFLLRSKTNHQTFF